MTFGAPPPAPPLLRGGVRWVRQRVSARDGVCADGSNFTDGVWEIGNWPDSDWPIGRNDDLVSAFGGSRYSTLVAAKNWGANGATQHCAVRSAGWDKVREPGLVELIQRCVARFGRRANSATSNLITGWPSTRRNGSTSCTFRRSSWTGNRPRRNFWRRSVTDQHLITVDELRAAGALEVPAAWRKSLRVESVRVGRDLFSGLFDDDPSPRGDSETTTLRRRNRKRSEGGSCWPRRLGRQ